MASDVGRASTRALAKKHGSCNVATCGSVYPQLRTLCPLILICRIAWYPSNPLWHIKIIAPQKRIGPRVCASPSHSFASSLESIELCTSGKGPPCNFEQGGWHADFRQGDTLEEGFLLDLSQLVWKLLDLQVLTMRKGTVHNFCDLCLREIHQLKLQAAFTCGRSYPCKI